MKRGKIYEKEFKAQFSGHETFPLRYGWLKKVFDEVYLLEIKGKSNEAKEIFLSDNAIARFGVGKNMVASMRHWADCCNIIEFNDDKEIISTKFAKFLLADDGLDPWMENSSSIWALHWFLCSSSSKASYNWLFNYFNGNQFDRPSMVKYISALCEELEWKNASEATLKRDVECLVRTYVNKPTKKDIFTEDQIESPLAELGLIQQINNNGLYQVKRGAQPSLGDGIFLFALIDFWNSFTANSRSLTLETIVYEPNSPGRVFCLDEDEVAGRLYNIEKYSNGIISWSETAGFRQVIANKPLEKIDPYKFLGMDYSNKVKEAA